MLVNISICDDEIGQREYLKMLTLKWSKCNNIDALIQTFESAESFLFAYIEKKEVDILLLDIQMGKQNGMELARDIRTHNDQLIIIFITGIPDFMNEGYEVSAFHYLMKPIKEDKFFQVLTKANEKLGKQEKTVLVSINGEQKKILQKSIVYIESFGHTVTLHTDTASYIISKSLSEFKQELEERSFVYCHRSYIVAIKFINKIGKIDIILDNEISIPLSRRMYKQVNQAFIAFYKGEN